MPPAAMDSPAHRCPEPTRRTVLGAAAAVAAGSALAGVSTPAAAAPAARAKPHRLRGGGDLGPNVLVFDPSTPGIQARLDEVFRRQESAQFDAGRYALLFKPGSYSGLNAQLGFYTSIAGLGLSPDDTTINGDVTVDAGWFNGNATQNFWRSAENLALVPVNGTNRWAVAQAAPFRRMHIRGGLNLAPSGYGWASGGYIADSRRRRPRRRRAGHGAVRGALQQIRRAVVRRTRPHGLLPEREGLRRPQPGRRPGRHGQGLRRLQGRQRRHHPRGVGPGQLLHYNVDPTIVQHSGFAAPAAPGVRFHDLLVVSLGGNGQYEHVINDTGTPTSGTATTPSTVTSYP